jgi:hypothetical protein
MDGEQGQEPPPMGPPRVFSPAEAGADARDILWYGPEQPVENGLQLTPPSKTLAPDGRARPPRGRLFAKAAIGVGATGFHSAKEGGGLSPKRSQSMRTLWRSLAFGS